MNRIFALVLLVIFFFSFNVELSAIHGIKQIEIEAIQARHASVEPELNLGETSGLRVPVVDNNKKSQKSRLHRVASKAVSSLSKLIAPKKYRERGSGMAVAALVLGIVGMLTIGFFVPSILAIVFGTISMKRYKEGFHDRKGMAKAGIILGIIGVAISAIYLVIILTLLLAW